jgi:hypothetical protein
VEDLNIAADAAAEEAKEEVLLFDISPAITPSFNPEADLYIYHNGERIVQYPTKNPRRYHEGINRETMSDQKSRSKILKYMKEIPYFRSEPWMLQFYLLTMSKNGTEETSRSHPSTSTHLATNWKR